MKFKKTFPCGEMENRVQYLRERVRVPAIVHDHEKVRNYQNMNHIVKRITILTGVFAAALGVFFFANNRWNSGQDQAVYMDMEAATLPGITVEMLGRDMNRLYGYRQEMNTTAAGENLTILPEDRALTVNITGGSVTGISYEVRSMDRGRLVEKTDVTDWQQTETGIAAVLPIQNLLTKEREYQLKIQLDTENFGPVYYYTRILWTDSAEHARAMVDLAADFSMKTFDYEQARSLATYLESSPSEDNSTFGHTSIHSSFSQLTWGKLNMQPEGTAEIRLKELDGVMCGIQLSYQAKRQGEGAEETYEVEEDFTMKWNELRIYMMQYDRTVNQIFAGDRSEYSGKRILLGITGDDRLEMVKSAGGKVCAYRVNRDLWSFEPGDRRAVKIFSFRDDDSTDVRSNYDHHDVRILSVEDSGDVDFLVYGYMNRGNHEGENGIAGYHYTASENALEERYFIPYSGSYEQLAADLECLTTQTAGGMLYLYVDHAIYGIDMNSRENMVVADSLTDGTFAVSTDKKRIAWQEGTLYESSALHLMDLETGEKRDVRAGNGEYVRTLGFVGRDLVYGTARAEDVWLVNGRTENLPMYNVRIINDQMEEETSYEKSGTYISEVTVDESRIHLKRVVKTGPHSYMDSPEDTIVCNAELGNGTLEGIGWYASPEKGRVYFVELDEELKSGRSIRFAAPKRVSCEQSDRLELKSNYQLSAMEFYAYGSGHLLKVTTDFSEALQLAYDHMGFVTDKDRNILWDRVKRGNIRNIRDPQSAFAPLARHLDTFTESQVFETENLAVLNARGSSLAQMLYFIDQGIPVAAYTGEGQYLILCGFDQYNVTVFDPQSGELYKAGLNDSTEYFRVRGNDFICAVSLP